MKMDLEFVCRSVQGKLLQGKPDQCITAVETDSRNICLASLFVPLRGERFDGHRFIADALQSGAAATLVEQRALQELDFPADKGVVLVEDTLQSLQNLARAYRQQFRVPVIAVTGSVGKTTTRQMIVSCLQQRYPVLHPSGNYNNEIGLPLTLLRMEPFHRAAVVELAMSARGEIEQLATISRPDYAVITNVAGVHLETLGSLENIAQAKCEVLGLIGEDGFALLNGDSPFLLEAAEPFSCRKYTFGYNSDCDFCILDAFSGPEGLTIEARMRGKQIKLGFPVPTTYLATNVIAAAALCELIGLDREEVQLGLDNYKPVGGRLRILKGPYHTNIIDDTYNANPLSMAAALETGREIKSDQGRLIAVLGDMFELGATEIEGHLAVGKSAARVGVTHLITVGQRAGYIAQGAIDAGLATDKVHSFFDKTPALEHLRYIIKDNDTIVFKASRGMQLETMIDKLMKLENQT